MFGMLDYRGHKLYWLLSVIPNFLLNLIAIGALAVVPYGIGKMFAEERLWEIVITVSSIIPMEIVFIIIVLGYSKLFDGIFFFFVDVEPADGRNKEDAMAVVRGGEFLRCVHLIDQDKNNWSDECVDAFVNTSIFFRSQRRERNLITRQYYQENPKLEVMGVTTNQLLAEKGLEPSYLEQIVTNHVYWRMAATYGLLICLIVIDPLH